MSAAKTPDVALGNKELVRQGTEEVINRGNTSYVDEYFTGDYIHHDGVATRNRDGFKTYFKELRDAFPDMQFRIDDEVAEGDRVLQRVTFTGTHAGPFRGLPPTGRAVSLAGFDLFRIEQGKIAEQWSVFDSAAMLDQLGVLPPPGASPFGFLGWAARTMGRIGVLGVRARRNAKKTS